MPKVVIDTSVFIAGLLTKNPLSSSAIIIDKWRDGVFTVVFSPQILRELVAKLIDKDFPEEIIVDLVRVIGKIGLQIPGAYETSKLDKSDSSDNMFLAAAYESSADWLVSLDKKSILKLKYFHGTQIRTPELFLRELMGLSDEDREDEELEELIQIELEGLKNETWARRQKEAKEFPK